MSHLSSVLPMVMCLLSLILFSASLLSSSMATCGARFWPRLWESDVTAARGSHPSTSLNIHLALVHVLRHRHSELTLAPSHFLRSDWRTRTTLASTRRVRVLPPCVSRPRPPSLALRRSPYVPWPHTASCSSCHVSMLAHTATCSPARLARAHSPALTAGAHARVCCARVSRRPRARHRRHVDP
jgi:hypothetical protein